MGASSLNSATDFARSSTAVPLLRHFFISFAFEISPLMIRCTLATQRGRGSAQPPTHFDVLIRTLKRYACIREARHNSFLLEMHHCVKSDEENENVERIKALSLIPAQSSLIASIFPPLRRENNRDLCLLVFVTCTGSKNCVPFKRFSEASKSTWAGKVRKKLLLNVIARVLCTSSYLSS